MHESDKKVTRKRRDCRILGIALLLLGACSDAPKAVTTDKPLQQKSVPEVLLDHHGDGDGSASRCGEAAYFKARLSGAINTDIELNERMIRCDSMQRPDDEGLRMRIRAAIDDEALAIIVAIPDLSAGTVADELGSNVTVTVEGSGRFFSTPDFDTCWTDIAQHDRLDIEATKNDGSSGYRVAGETYCLAALGELNGSATVSIETLEFSTNIAWQSTR